MVCQNVQDEVISAVKLVLLERIRFCLFFDRLFIIYVFEDAAGLYCGILLAEAGHTVTIFEATDRAGGRIQTYRDPKNPSKYIANLGPFRFPLGIQPYMNYLLRQQYKLNITEFPSNNVNIDTNMNKIFQAKL